VAGDLKDKLGVRHRYRKTGKSSLSESDFLVNGPQNSVDVEANDDYVPTPIAMEGLSAARPEEPTTPPRSHSRSGGPAQSLEAPARYEVGPISAAALSYYTPSMLPPSSSGESSNVPPTQYQQSSPPSTPGRPSTGGSIPNLIFRNGHVRALGTDAQPAEYEMRVRSGLSTTALGSNNPYSNSSSATVVGAYDPRAPDEVHPGPVRERQLAYPLSSSVSENMSPPRNESLMEVSEGSVQTLHAPIHYNDGGSDDPPWSAAHGIAM
jgi:hypothetical protein